MSNEPQKRSSHMSRTAAVLSAVALLVVILAAAWAGWWFTIYPTTPQYAASQFLDAAKSRDYRQLYESIEMPDLVRKVVPNEQAFQRILENAPSTFPPLASYTIESTKVTGDQASVHATVTSVGDAEPNELDIKLHRTDGRWMIDGRWMAALMARNGGVRLLKLFGPRLLGL